MSSRIDALRSLFEAAEIDSLIVTTPANVRYLCGFTGSAGALLLTGDATTLVTDGRYAIQAPVEVENAGADVDVLISNGPGFDEHISAVTNAAFVGLEADDVSWATAERYRSAVDTTVVATEGLVEGLREFKDAGEVDKVRMAGSIADNALDAVRSLLADEPTEVAFARALDNAMVAGGADRPAFETIVAGGVNSASPHHRPGDHRISEGDLLLVDFGAEHDGYRSDMTRSFVIGSPDPRRAEMLDAVLAAQTAGAELLGPGVPTSDIDKACRDVLDDAGMAKWFTHGTGHGVGLDIHEAPSVAARSAATLAPGHVITVEPGVYIPDVGGVRWEDTFVVTADGAERLTNAAKDPIVTPEK